MVARIPDTVKALSYQRMLRETTGVELYVSENVYHPNYGGGELMAKILPCDEPSFYVWGDSYSELLQAVRDETKGQCVRRVDGRCKVCGH